ncbi:LysE family translocator [Nitratireductor alexandrii]|uniref:LysE family translocator n=1 Tax=Nitratireductor alexandrii TaxID=2448161 RepID=UPI000FDC9DE4|nr:LysE family transporter [Nitratireductor alexandrii]
MEDLIGFLVAGFVLTGSPGPNTLSLAATGAAFGARRGLGYMTGLLLGMVLVMGLTASGVIAIVLAVPALGPVVTAAAAAYFLYLAWRIANAPPLSEARQTKPAPSAGDGIVLSLLNPKAYAAMAAMFTGFVLFAGSSIVDAFIKAGLLLVILTLVNTVWLAGGALLTRVLREPRLNRIVNVAFAALLILSVVLALSI